MTEKQKNKLLSLMSEILIPTITKIQSSKFCPYRYSFGLTDKNIFSIDLDGNVTVSYENYVRSILNGPPHRQIEYKPVEKDKIGDITFGLSTIRSFPIVIKDLAKSMVVFLKNAEQYQKDIEEIIRYSENICLPDTRNVLLGKNKTMKNNTYQKMRMLLCEPKIIINNIV
jgi:hypothetical protein